GRDRVDVVRAAQAGHAHLLFTGPLQQPEHHVAGAAAAACPDHRVERLDPFAGLFGVDVGQLAGQAVADDREALASGGHGGSSPSYGGRLDTGPESSCRRAFSPLAAFAVVHLNLHTRRRLVHLYRWVTWWSGRWPGTARGPGAPLQTAFRGPNCDRDFKLWANCDLRTAATQCGLSHQEVPMPQTPRLTPATARGRARAAGGGLRERNQGGR